MNLLTQVPEVCYRHPGCQSPVCHRLHICLLFLADLCPHGDRCFRGHSLATAHNQRVWDRVASDADSEAERVALLFSYYQQSGRLPDWLYRNNLRICPRPACDGACRRLHLCRDWVAGECFRSSCKFSHTLRSEHNMTVLRRFHLAEEGDTALLRLLEDRCTAQRHRSDQELECAVCLELFRRATTLGCGHTFCADCVRSTRRCPLCRAPVTSATRSVTLDSIIGSLSAAQGADRVTGALYPELGHTGPH
ncbi:E3 ubiquitin-protein ligase rnf8-B [Amphibalanus amphitrite]|uniref:E3 ubiquitin-protein ligase rnf8-B n=1 Tax=Amphibalanus amphitrite TaxID=1232801 RepID=A0A6A4XA78_AMPAM|nr:E3 ubiquitin-protein ligase rnf8-B [Amphibalanus amphitrite]